MNFKKNALKFSVAVAGAVTLGFAATSIQANADEIYTVKSGDTLSGISFTYANDYSLIDSLASNNNIADKNLIYVGEQLMITDNGTIREATDQEVATTPAADESATASTDTTSSAATSSAATDTTSTTTTTDTTSASSTYTSNVSGSEAAAKAWIANKESGGSYTASNGQYYGKYQLSLSYLNGDTSAANQEAVADNYVTSRYGSWVAAQTFWQQNGWY